MRRHSEKVSVDFVDGRATSAPELHTVKAIWDTNELNTTQAEMIMELITDTSESPIGYQAD